VNKPLESFEYAVKQEGRTGNVAATAFCVRFNLGEKNDGLCSNSVFVTMVGFCFFMNPYHLLGKCSTNGTFGCFAVIGSLKLTISRTGSTMPE
jgi:hypothetical protein